MQKHRPKPRQTGSQRFMLGRVAFAKISAIEGIDLNGAVRRDLEAFDRAGLSNAARRAAVTAKYGMPKP